MLENLITFAAAVFVGFCLMVVFVVVPKSCMNEMERREECESICPDAVFDHPRFGAMKCFCGTELMRIWP